MILLVDMLWLGGFVLAVVVIGCVLLTWGMVAIGRVSDQHRLPPIDDTYTVEGDEDWDADGDPEGPGPGRHLPDSPQGSSRPGSGSSKGGDRAV